MLVGIERVGQFFPVDQIRAHGVAPGHVAPIPTVGIVLIEQVILAFVENQPIGIIQPTAPGSKMKLRTQGFVVNLLVVFDGVRLINLFQAQGVFRQLVNLEHHGFSLERRNVQESPPVRFGIGQFNLELTFRFSAHHQLQGPFSRAIFYRQIQIMFLHLERKFHILLDHPSQLVIRLENLVNTDMTPAAGRLIHDFQNDTSTFQRSHIPSLPVEMLAASGLDVRSRNGADQLVIAQQIDAGLSGKSAATD